MKFSYLYNKYIYLYNKDQKGEKKHLQHITEHHVFLTLKNDTACIGYPFSITYELEFSLGTPVAFITGICQSLNKIIFLGALGTIWRVVCTNTY